MAPSDSGTPPDATDAAAGPAATEAFKLLGNETRLTILSALWDAYEPFASDSDNAVRFSDLRQRVGTADSGRFNYHLDQLTDHFVRRTDAGYALSEAGRTIVQSVIAGTGVDDPTLDPVEVDMACGQCGGGVEVYYRDGYVYNACTDCEGLYADGPDGRGYLSKLPLHPAGLAGRSAGELYAAAWVNAFQTLYNMIEGVCGSCSGRVAGSLAICPDHDDSDDGVCETCGRRPEVTAEFRCAVCKDSAVTTMGGVAKYHPAVVALYYDRGLSLQYGFNELPDINQRLETGTTTVTVTARDPPHVRVRTEVDTDAVELDIDADVTVSDVTVSRAD
jgi:DNA-binding transcriptional ArsR family regulator